MSLLAKIRSYESFFDNKLISKKPQTRKLYKYSIADFDKFCRKQFSNSLENLLPEFKKAKTEEVIDVLQAWVNSSDNQTSNLKARFNQINNYLYYRGVKIDIRDLKDVEFSNSQPEERMPLKKDDLIRILDDSNARQKALYLALSSSGMAIGEACHLVKSDFDFSLERVQIHIKMEYTKKSSRGRTVFISKEAEKALMPIINKLSQDQRVFGYAPSVEKSIENYSQQFRRVVERLGMGQKYGASNQSKRQKTLHALRAYFFTGANRINGLDYAHKMTGHKGYLSMYNRLDDKDKLEMYIKCEPELLVYSSTEIEELKKIEGLYRTSLQKIALLDEKIALMDKKLGL